MSLLCEAEDKETGGKFTNDEIIDELMGFLIAGYETTSSTVSWFLYHISQHMEIQQKIQKEVDTVLAGTKLP